jgi:hypothetical protein
MAESTRSTEAHNYDYASAANFLVETYGELTIEDITRQYPSGAFNIAKRILASEVINTSSSVSPVLLAMQRAPPSETAAALTLQWKTPQSLFQSRQVHLLHKFCPSPNGATPKDLVLFIPR